jgi:hypothetical protein
MSNSPEFTAIKAIDEALNTISDQKTRDRVLSWAWDKYSTKESITHSREEQQKSLPKTKPKRKSNKSKGKKKVLSLSIIKDLNLKPTGKKTFKAFIDEKKPISHPEKCAVSVYYLAKELGLKGITSQHVYTCYKEAKWRVPANLLNKLSVTASEFGLIDTSDMEDIQISTRGENLIEQDLPRQEKGK